MDTREAFNWTHALGEAKAIVRGSPLFKKFISGTPLENDIPVWIVEFASKLWVWKELETAIADSWVMQGKIKSLEADLQAALNQPQPPADVVERVARALAVHDYRDNGLETLTPFTEIAYADRYWQDWTEQAKAAIAALPQQPSLPQGMTEAIEALLGYNQMDEDGIMVCASRQAIHEVVDYLRALSALPGNSVKGVEEAPKLSFVEALKEAKAIVAQSPLYRKYIDGTPLQNDIAVWMAEFAVKHSSTRKEQ